MSLAVVQDRETTSELPWAGTDKIEEPSGDLVDLDYEYLPDFPDEQKRKTNRFVLPYVAGILQYVHEQCGTNANRYLIALLQTLDDLYRNDMIAHLEEVHLFLLWLPHTDYKAAFEASRRLLTTLQTPQFSCLPAALRTMHEMPEFLDRALYQVAYFFMCQYLDVAYTRNALARPGCCEDSWSVIDPPGMFFLGCAKPGTCLSEILQFSAKRCAVFVYLAPPNFLIRLGRIRTRSNQLVKCSQLMLYVSVFVESQPANVQEKTIVAENMDALNCFYTMVPTNTYELSFQRHFYQNICSLLENPVSVPLHSTQLPAGQGPADFVGSLLRTNLSLKHMNK